MGGGDPMGGGDQTGEGAQMATGQDTALGSALDGNTAQGGQAANTPHDQGEGSGQHAQTNDENQETSDDVAV